MTFGADRFWPSPGLPAFGLVTSFGKSTSCAVRALFLQTNNLQLHDMHLVFYDARGAFSMWALVCWHVTFFLSCFHKYIRPEPFCVESARLDSSRNTRSNSMSAMRTAVIRALAFCNWKGLEGAVMYWQFHLSPKDPKVTHSVSCQYWHIFPESVWAKGSSNSGVCQTFSHNIFKSSHLLIFTSSHLHICSSLHLFIFTSSHLHIFSSSHLFIFTSFHLHICSSSHLLIFTSSHLLIFTSAHLLNFSSSHLYILSCPLALLPSCSLALLHLFIFTSHLLIFTSSHLHICTSSHLHILSCPHALLPSCSLLLVYFSLEGAGQCQRDGTKRNRFARNEVRSPKTEVKLRFASCPAQRFRTKWGSVAKNWGKIAICKASGEPCRTKCEVRSPKTILKICKASGATLSHKMRFDRQKLR